MSKVKTRCYICKKCNKTVYFQLNTQYETKCKTCNCEMQLLWEHDYRPNNALRAIKNSNIKDKNTEYNKRVKPIVECPYCHSKDTKKISIFSKVVHEAISGIYSISRNSKQWHCNNCNSDF